MGEFLKLIRQRRANSLREFCRVTGFDPSNWSKYERGKLKVSTEKNAVLDWAKFLGIKKGSGEWHEFFDCLREMVLNDALQKRTELDQLQVEK